MDTLIFDVNETLLDLSVIRPHFEQHFGDGNVMREWFGLLLRKSMVETLTGGYRSFDGLAFNALETIAGRRGVQIATFDINTVVNQFRHLPAHDDVVPTFEQLRDAGYSLVALTNSSAATMLAQLTNAELAPYFDQMLSVEAVQKFKPHPAVYQYAAEQIGRPINECRMIAVHDWDITGACRAGMKGAYISRKEFDFVTFGNSTANALFANGLTDLVNQLINE